MQVLVTAAYLTAIANAIRAKNGKATKYKPADMAAAILQIGSSSGGGGTTPPPTPPPGGKTKVGGFTLAAKADGSLSGYTAGKIMMALPNHQIAMFRAVIFCPAGLELASMVVSDFANGRAWKKDNAYCSSPTRTVVEGGTRYVMEWEELVNITKDEDYVYDDDKTNDKLTYYCCSESSVKAVTGSSVALTEATLTMDAFI